jgi:hypothetical protein
MLHSQVLKAVRWVEGSPSAQRQIEETEIMWQLETPKLKKCNMTLPIWREHCKLLKVASRCPRTSMASAKTAAVC